MKFVTEEITTIIEIKKSKFIASLFPYENFYEVMKRLKMKHPKARHHVYAYRYLNEFDQIVENCSDDGEPRGTSGRPSLKVMNGQGLINSAVIIVRYFGGIKLGTGGLLRAYSDAVNEVIMQSKLHVYQKLISKTVKFSYTQLSSIEYVIKELNIQISKKQFQSDVVFHLNASKVQFASLEKALPHGVNLI